MRKKSGVLHAKAGLALSKCRNCGKQMNNHIPNDHGDGALRCKYKTTVWEPILTDEKSLDREIIRFRKRFSNGRL